MTTLLNQKEHNYSIWFLDAIASLNFTLSLPPSLCPSVRHHLYQMVPVSIQSYIAGSVWTLESFKPLPTSPKPLPATTHHHPPLLPTTIHQQRPRNFETSTGCPRQVAIFSDPTKCIKRQKMMIELHSFERNLPTILWHNTNFYRKPLFALPLVFERQM